MITKSDVKNYSLLRAVLDRWLNTLENDWQNFVGDKADEYAEKIEQKSDAWKESDKGREISDRVFRLAVIRDTIETVISDMTSITEEIIALEGNE